MQLLITPIWTDDDSLMQVRVSLAGNGRRAWGEAYGYPETFAEFGQALIGFPSSTADEVTLELGSTGPVHADHLLIRAFVYDRSGHCAVEFKAQSRGDALMSSFCQFAAPTEAASLNEMGKRIVAWASRPMEPFAFDGAGP